VSAPEVRFAAPLVRARLIRRYKRFLADMALASGETVTAHCPNPGSMMGLAEPGLACWLEPTPQPGRKLAFAWRLVELPGGHMAGIDATLPNRLIGAALRAGALAPLAGQSAVRAEVRYGRASRVDFLLDGPAGQTFVEVKNVHLRRDEDWAEFPDCVTTRGARHLNELAGMARAGHRAVLLYLVQRTDCARLRLAADLDPAYARAAAAARGAGVEMLAFGARITPEAVALGDQLPVAAPAAA
jgi:sugar fermentation stimulation protein A